MRLVRWFLAPFVDGWEGLSLTRFLAIYFAVVVGHAIEAGHAISGNTVWLAIAAAAIAFGKSTFTFFLRRVSLQSQSTDLTARVETIKKDATLGYEPAP